MAGGTVKYRHLSRNSAHRQALLRNLVTALIQHESIRTTWPKAKETQRMADRLITLAKRNNETSRRKAHGILFTPEALLPKLFGELRRRYEARPGGYTRVLRTEPRSQYDQAPSAILQLVDGPKDLRFAVTAAAVARDRRLGRPSNGLTLLNRAKVLRYRDGAAGAAGSSSPAAEAAFEAMVSRMASMRLDRFADGGGGDGDGDGRSGGGGGDGGAADNGPRSSRTTGADAGAGAGAGASRGRRRITAAPPGGDSITSRGEARGGRRSHSSAPTR